ENHVIEIRPTSAPEWGMKYPIQFKKLGLKHALSLVLFCAEHDAKLFKKVESPPVNYLDPECQLLLTFRVVCSEIRKKEVVREQCSAIAKSQIIQKYGGIDNIRALELGTIRGIQNLLEYKKLLEAELSSNKNNFKFHTMQYPPLSVYCSAAFSPYKTILTPFSNELIKYLFIHVIPTNDNLVIILGYHKNFVENTMIDYIDSWKNRSRKELEVLITNLFATKVESWGISPKLFENIKEHTLEKFLEYFLENANNHLWDQRVEFNLFDDKNQETVI
ncbi:MAG TPA: hypothetical protein VHS96_03105, partial [Bacteroidia bacterium]|nr:hypothetical protein [Bacteroidia bacterium]